MKRVVALVLLSSLLTAGGVIGQERQTADVHGTTLSYVEIGSGEPLLLLHGFGETGATWDPVLPALASEYRVIVPDLPGHGYSEQLNGDFTFREAATDISALLDHLEIPRTRAMGFSAGGLILLHLVTDEVERIASMVVIGAGPYLTESARTAMRGMDVESIPMEVLQSGELAQPDTARTRHLLRQFVGLAENYRDPNFSPPLLGTIRASTLLVTGDRDPFFPPSVVQEMHAAIPRSHLFVLPNHEHYPFPAETEGRDYFVSLVLAFLRGGWGGP